MKILVFGAGVIGSIYGWLLAKHDHEITLYVRKGKKSAYRQGLEFKVLDGRTKPYKELTETFIPTVIDALSPTASFDLVLVCVKEHQLLEALPLLKNAFSHTHLLFLGNNWAGPKQNIDTFFTKSQYSLGLGASGGIKRGNVITGAIAKDIRLGTPDDQEDKEFIMLKTLFTQIGLQVVPIVDIVHWYWVHYAFNAAMISGAIKAKGFDRFIKNNTCIREAVLAARDAMDIVKARGIDPLQFADARAAFTPLWIAPLVFRWIFKDAVTFRVANMHGQDKAEICRIYDDVLQTANTLHLQVPQYREFQSYVDALKSKV